MLHTERIHREHVGTTRVVERVEDYADVVVGASVGITLGERRPDAVGILVVGFDSEVDGVGINDDLDLSPLRCGRAFYRVELCERREQCTQLPRGVVQTTVHVDSRSLDGGGLDFGLSVDAIVCDGVDGRSLRTQNSYRKRQF